MWLLGGRPLHGLQESSPFWESWEKSLRSQNMKGDTSPSILGDPGAESGGKGKSKRAEKYSTEKSKERRE